MTDRPGLTCTEVFERLDDYLDRNLSADELALVARHLDECVVCAGEYRFEATVLEGLKARLRRIEAPPYLLSSIMLRLQAEPDTD
ncbi:MAG: anti-sigma factor family protein [Gemmatimonadales bacterium]